MKEMDTEKGQMLEQKTSGRGGETERREGNNGNGSGEPLQDANNSVDHQVRNDAFDRGPW